MFDKIKSPASLRALRPLFVRGVALANVVVAWKVVAPRWGGAGAPLWVVLCLWAVALATVALDARAWKKARDYAWLWRRRQFMALLGDLVFDAIFALLVFMALAAANAAAALYPVAPWAALWCLTLANCYCGLLAPPLAPRRPAPVPAQQT